MKVAVERSSPGVATRAVVPLCFGGRVEPTDHEDVTRYVSRSPTSAMLPVAALTTLTTSLVGTPAPVNPWFGRVTSPSRWRAAGVVGPVGLRASPSRVVCPPASSSTPYGGSASSSRRRSGRRRGQPALRPRRHHRCSREPGRPGGVDRDRPETSRRTRRDDVGPVPAAARGPLTGAHQRGCPGQVLPPGI